MRSINFSSRGRTRERGFVIAAALLIAVLYFALMELLLLDTSRSLQDAQRFRSRVIATTIAEDQAELAAAGMVAKYGGNVDRDDTEATATGKYERTGCCNFELNGDATTKGVPPATAHVNLQGRITGTTVSIDYARHTP